MGAALAGSGLLGGPATTEAARRAVQLSGGRGVHTAALAAYPHPHEMIVQIQCVRFMLSEELLECQQGDECRA